MLLQEKLPEDPFNVYWRETMRMLIRRKFGEHALSKAEMAREWSVIDNIDLPSVFARLQQLTVIRPTPYTPHPTPYTLHPIPHPKPYTPHPAVGD